MNRSFIIAAALAAFATTASAQADGTMSEGYDMLTAALANDFERLGIETEGLDNLTLGQIAAIKSIADGGDGDGEKRNRIEAILNQ